MHVGHLFTLSGHAENSQFLVPHEFGASWFIIIKFGKLETAIDMEIQLPTLACLVFLFEISLEYLIGLRWVSLARLVGTSLSMSLAYEPMREAQTSQLLLYCNCLGSTNNTKGYNGLMVPKIQGAECRAFLFYDCLPEKKIQLIKLKTVLKSGFLDVPNLLQYNEVATKFLMFLALVLSSYLHRPPHPVTSPKNSHASEGLNSTTNQQASAGLNHGSVMEDTPVTATSPAFRASYLPSRTESCTPWVQMEGALPQTKAYYQKQGLFDQVWPSNSKSQIPLETFTSAGPWVRRVNHCECHLLNFFLPKQILRAWIWGTRGSRRYLLRLCFGPLCKQIILNQAMNV